jgi:hypothetical protein
VTRLETERFGAPAPARDFALARDRALDALAGRTVWFAAPLPASQRPAERLSERLGWARDRGVPVTRLTVTGGEALRRSAQELDAALHGVATALRPPGGAERELFAEDLQGAELVGRGDVVVMHDALSAALTQPLRESGAHAVWYVSDGTTAIVAAAWEFLRPYTAAIDAYVVSWSERGARHVAAVMPGPDRVAQKDLGPGGDDLGWSSLLAAVVRDDRADRVGGARRPRPVVAAR